MSNAVSNTASKAASEGLDGLTLLARLGYAARGAVYVIVGGLAVMAAFGGGGGTTGSRGALKTLLDEPGGQILLGVIALGLVGYAIWRFLQSVLDVDDHGTDGKGLVVRAGLLVSGFTHVLLAFYTCSLIFGWFGGGGGSEGGGGGGKQGLSAALISMPGGQWILGFIGICVIGAGIAQFFKGFKSKFEKWLAMDPAKLNKVSWICRFGLMARGVVFCMMGAFLIYAAVQANPNKAKGLGAILQTLREQPYGPWLLGIVAFGLLAFAIYSFIEARYRRIHPENV